MYIEKLITKKLPKSQVEITGEIPVIRMKELRKKALANFQKEAEFDGFRKGNVPENILVKKIGETNILEEAAEIGLQEEMAEIITSQKIDVIGRPHVVLTKVAPENEVTFTITLTLIPEVKLGDYKKIAQAEMAIAEEKIEITEKDIEKVIEEVRKMKAMEAHDHDHKTNPDHSHDVEQPLPEMNDTFVKSLGDFKDISDFKEKVKTNLLAERTAKAKEKKKVAILEKLVAESEIEVPELLVESELGKMAGQFQDDIERMGVKYEDYLKHIKKTPEMLREEWKKDAEKRARVQLIFNAIAAKEKIAPSEEDIEKETKLITEHYKEAKAENVRVYVETVLTNDRIFKFLEEQN